MSLKYERICEKPPDRESLIYPVFSRFSKTNEKFLSLKANVCDLNPALVTKTITGTEQDFRMMMDRAKTFLHERYKEMSEAEEKALLEMFRQCVFGWYVLTPLLEDKNVSDIKVLSHDHIVVKALGRRYMADCSFFSEEDYRDWVCRILSINRISRNTDAPLLCWSDTKSCADFYLRVDVQMPSVTSDQSMNIHIRKIPKEKKGWESLKQSGMLDEDKARYIKDRVSAGYGFLISGRGGSGKTTLLNALIDEIPFSESVLVVQESDELYSDVHPQIQFEHTLNGYSLEDELRLGLLQDIDNFVIGEIKGGEALYVFTTALSTGARFFGTIHSNDAEGSIVRLAQCARYVSDYRMETLFEMLSGVRIVLIHMSSFSIDEILETDSFDEKTGRLSFKKVFRKGDAC